MKIRATLESPNGQRTLELKNRQDWMLYHLAQAGERAVTTIEQPALRIAAYVHTLKKRGFSIETELEPHDGTYAGQHAGYRLRSAVSICVLAEGGQV